MGGGLGCRVDRGRQGRKEGIEGVWVCVRIVLSLFLVEELERCYTMSRLDLLLDIHIDELMVTTGWILGGKRKVGFSRWRCLSFYVAIFSYFLFCFFGDMGMECCLL